MRFYFLIGVLNQHIFAVLECILPESPPTTLPPLERIPSNRFSHDQPALEMYRQPPPHLLMRLHGPQIRSLLSLLANSYSLNLILNNRASPDSSILRATQPCKGEKKRGGEQYRQFFRNKDKAQYLTDDDHSAAARFSHPFPPPPSPSTRPTPPIPNAYTIGIVTP